MENFNRMEAQKGYTLASEFVTSNIKNGKFVDPSFKADSSALYNSL